MELLGERVSRGDEPSPEQARRVMASERESSSMLREGALGAVDDQGEAGGQPVDGGALHLGQERALRREVAVDRTDRRVGLVGQPLHGEGVEALVGDDREGGVEEHPRPGDAVLLASTGIRGGLGHRES